MSKIGNVPRIDDRRVRMAINRLPYKNQEVIYMRFWDLLTIEEIAQSMRISWINANRLIDTSLAMLKKLLLSEFK